MNHYLIQVVFTNKIDKSSLIISEININNTYSNLFNVNDSILNL